MRPGPLSRLTLATKLLVPPVVGLIALALVAATAYYGLRWQRLTINSINDVRFGHLQLALEASSFAQEAHQALTRRLVVPLAERDPALVKISDGELLARIHSAVPTLNFLGGSDDLDEREQRAVEQAKVSLRAYIGLVEKTLSARDVDANAIRAVDSQFEVLSWNMGRLVAIERDLTTSAFEESGRRSTRILVAFSVLFTLALLVSVGVAVIVTRHVRSRVEAIRIAAADLASGNPARRAEVEGDDEIGETARAFNFLVDELDRAMSQLKVANQQLSGEMLAIIDASQAMSSETDLGSLKARVVDLLAIITGATQVLLAYRDSKGEEGDELPQSVMRVARESAGPIAVKDATHDPRFAEDPYFACYEQCALLVVPVVNYGQPRAVLMLENTTRPDAFSGVSQDVVMLIARQLAISLENVGVYRDLEQLVQQRTVELRAAQEELVASAHRAGMAEVATNVLHNVGNVLNSVNVSVSLIRSQLRESRVSGLAKAVKMLDENSEDLANFLAVDRRGLLLREYLRELTKAHAQEQWALLNDTAALARNIDHIKEIVSMQQSFARRGAAFVEMIHIDELIGDAVRVNGESVQASGAIISKQIEGQIPPLSMDRHRMMLVLVNLIRNACQAVADVDAKPPEVKLSAGMVGGERLRVVVSDTGRGIDAEDLPRIFSHGFTTRSGGHGFGLHSCALAAMEMGGELTAASEGPNRGATFTLEVPVDHGR